jgi:hypothetical protein
LQGGSGSKEFNLIPQTSNLKLPTEWEHDSKLPAEITPS